MVVLQVEFSNGKQQMTVPQRSFKFTQRQSGIAHLTCCFEFQGAHRLTAFDVIPKL